MQQQQLQQHLQPLQPLQQQPLQQQQQHQQQQQQQQQQHQQQQQQQQQQRASAGATLRLATENHSGASGQSRATVMGSHAPTMSVLRSLGCGQPARGIGRIMLQCTPYAQALACA